MPSPLAAAPTRCGGLHSGIACYDAFSIYRFLNVEIGTVSNEFKINNFDLLRIFAATQVLVGHGIYHLGLEWPSWWAPFALLPGVPIFFVISGFLISAAWERSERWQIYTEARVLRIFPALWCCIALTVLVFGAMGVNFAHWQTIPWLAAQSVGLVYTPGFLRDFGMGSYNGSLWTIPLELQFYCVLPLIYWAMTRTGRSTRTLLGAVLVFVSIALLARVFFPSFGRHYQEGGEPLLEKLLRYSFLPHFYLFLIGVTLQRLKAYQWHSIRGKGIYWLAAYMAFNFLIPGNVWTYIPSMILLGVSTIALAYTVPELAERLLRRQDMSYGVYIYHGLLLNVFLEIGWRGDARYVWALCAATFVMAWLSWRYVERPCLSLKGRWTSRPANWAGAGPSP